MKIIYFFRKDTVFQIEKPIRKGMKCMDWRTVERFLSSGQAFVPVYTEDKGDAMQLYFKDGSSEILDMRSETFFIQAALIISAQVSLLIEIVMGS